MERCRLVHEHIKLAPERCGPLVARTAHQIRAAVLLWLHNRQVARKIFKDSYTSLCHDIFFVFLSTPLCPLFR